MYSKLITYLREDIYPYHSIFHYIFMNPEYFIVLTLLSKVIYHITNLFELSKLFNYDYLTLIWVSTENIEIIILKLFVIATVGLCV